MKSLNKKQRTEKENKETTCEKKKIKKRERKSRWNAWIKMNRKQKTWKDMKIKKRRMTKSMKREKAKKNTKFIFVLPSKRFGKFIKIFVNSVGSYSGAKIQNFLLEKTRVVYQVSRNFSSFFTLFSSLASIKQEKIKRKVFLYIFCRFIKEKSTN